METLISFYRATILLLVFFLSVSCDSKVVTSEVVLVGSTPGDESIKSMLSIPADTKIDFMRWNLKLDSKKSFVLDLEFGESQPNALGFKNGGEKRTITGKFAIDENGDKSNFQEIYQLKSSSLPEKISLVKLNQNLFHILTSQNRLMNGNGGWSYSLNRKNPISSNKILFSSGPLDQSLQLVFDGRTPCQEIAAEHPEMNAGQSCFKLKWRLILNRDSLTHQPTTCTIRNIVNNQPRDISGTWKIINGTETNPEAIIYRIEVDNLAEPILFLAGDENVLFFLDRNKEPFIGNEDFSFTLNKNNNSEIM
jgi:hypothetical protein